VKTKLKFLAKIEKQINALSSMTGIVSGYFAVLMAFIVTYDVFMRFVLRQPTIWVFETSEYLLVIIIFCGAPYCLLKDGHVQVELLTERMPERMRRFIHLVNTSIAMVLSAVLTVGAWKFWWPAYANRWTTDSLLSAPLYVAYLFMAVGLSVLTLQYIVKVAEGYRHMRHPAAEREGETR
jgi:TRAP-type C4-dicarboxylate transport system permease small subunit